MFILQKLNSERNGSIAESIKTSKKLFILIDHENTKNIQSFINNKLKNLDLSDIEINIISPKYENLTTIFNEYQEEQSNFDPEKLAQRIMSKL